MPSGDETDYAFFRSLLRTTCEGVSSISNRYYAKSSVDYDTANSFLFRLSSNYNSNSKTEEYFVREDFLTLAYGLHDSKELLSCALKS